MSQRGFTLLELLLAMAIFALLAAGSARLLDVMVRAQHAREAQADALGSVARAMALIQRDAAQGLWPTALKDQGHGLSLDGGRISWVLAGPEGPRIVSYWLQDGALWRQRRSLDEGAGARQRVLDSAVEVSWRLHVAPGGWATRWPLTTGQQTAPQLLEVTVSTQRLRHIRRVLPLSGSDR